MIAKYAIALIVVILLAAAFAWAFLPARYLPGNRARHLRIRLHLRLHPGKGFAHVFSLWLRWGRFAALRRSARVRAALPLWYRIAEPHQHSVFLGRAHYRHGLRVPLEEHLLVMAPPRTYKTAFLADVILSYPGPVIATSTKPDLYDLTSGVRAQLGPVHVFNPQHIGGVPSTFCWSPVDGCQDPATAIRRADAFAFAVSAKAVEDATFWSAKASDYLRGYFHAAALARYDLRTVASWVSGADPDVPERILLAAGARQWAHTLAELRSEAHKTAATVRMVMSRSLAFMADPALAASVLPGPGDGFDIPAFLDGADTVYLIAEAVSEEAPVAPILALACRDPETRPSSSSWTPPPLTPSCSPSPRTPASEKPTSARSSDPARACPRAPTANATARPSPPARHGWPAGYEPSSTLTGRPSSATRCALRPTLPEPSILPSMCPTREIELE
jgi:type IV secretion system protein VirD4